MTSAIAVPDRAQQVVLRAEEKARRDQLLWKWTIWGGRALLLCFILFGWEWGAGRIVDEAYVSRPTAVAAAWWDLAASGTLWHNAQFTLTAFLAGYFLGAALGIVCACLVTIRAFFYKVVEPYLFALYGIPKLAIAPLLALWFGIGLTPKIVLATLTTFLLTFMSTVAGIRSASPQMVSVLKVMGAQPLDLYRQLIIPHALPFILTSLRLTIPIAMIAAILGEFLGARGGLGHLLAEQATFLAVDYMMAVIVTLAAFVMLFRSVLIPLEKWVNRHQSNQLGGAK